ncbi:MAG: AAA family ATPase [Candidatus Rhabdochlamydia sp.]
MNSFKQHSAFSSLIGNVNVKEKLTSFLLKDKIPKVLLFLGPIGIGKTRFAEAFAKAIIQTSQFPHPDIHTLYPDLETRQHPIAKLRELIQETLFPPFQSQYKVFIIGDIEKMVPTSMNTLLKTLEEPPADTLFILTSSFPSEILPTVLSRSSKISFTPIADEDMVSFLMKYHNVSEEKGRKLAFLAEGSIAKALERLPHLPLLEGVKKALKATSYLEIYDCLSDKNLMVDTLLPAVIESLLEDIIYFVHEQDRGSLPRVLELIRELKHALDHHVKLKTALEYFLISYRLM